VDGGTEPGTAGFTMAVAGEQRGAADREFYASAEAGCQVGIARHRRTSEIASPPDGLAVQLRPTALTTSAGAGTPAARMLPRIDWIALFGVSCNALLGDGAVSRCASAKFPSLRHVDKRLLGTPRERYYVSFHEFYEPGVQPRLLLFPVRLDIDRSKLPAVALNRQAVDGVGPILDPKELPVPLE